MRPVDFLQIRHSNGGDLGLSNVPAAVHEWAGVGRPGAR
jgi:hypothetical protein